MTLELLQLIERWRERHPDAWPINVQIVDGGVFLYGYRKNHPAALALIESAVMDWVIHMAVRVIVYPLQVIIVAGDLVTGENGVMRSCKGQHEDRIHALLLAVEEMEAK